MATCEIGLRSQADPEIRVTLFENRHHRNTPYERDCVEAARVRADAEHPAFAPWEALSSKWISA